jgi:hypothetical protein
VNRPAPSGQAQAGTPRRARLGDRPARLCRTGRRRAWPCQQVFYLPDDVPLVTESRHKPEDRTYQSPHGPTTRADASATRG